MNFDSIKWRLQIWYGLVLVAVLAGLGIAAFQLEKSKLYRQVDDKLRQRMRVLADALNGPPMMGRGPDFPEPGEPPPPAGNQRRPDRMNFRLPPGEQALFGTNEPGGFYFIVYGAGGEKIGESANVPGAYVPAPPQPGRPPIMNGSNREMDILTPTHERIIVGGSVALETAELHLTALKLAGVGGVILLLGLSVGWLLVSRALRPIDDISAVAEKIATGNLAQRIDIAQTRSELGRLAEVLNSTFARLDAAFTQQKRFAADAAHELRTPVSVLIAQTEAALNRKRTYEENLQTIEACHRASQRMRRLTTSLLQLARLDAGQEVLTRSKFDLSEMVEECAESVQTIADERGVKIILDAPPVEVFGDAAQLSLVVMNLVTNAIQYNKPQGEIRIQLRSETDRAVFSVTNAGLPIPQADLRHIFERFYRADKSRSSGNAGLGLAISKAIVDAHSGTIEVTSTEAVGTTFVVRLPNS